jgi:nucleotide-binding universal stress UspA family protein
MEVIRAVPGVRSRLPVSTTIEEARASLHLARLNFRRDLAAGGKGLQDVLVPLLRPDAPESYATIACRLAKADGQKTRVHLAYYLEIPRHLPLNSPLAEEEQAAAYALAAAEKLVRREGLTAMTHVARTRDTGDEIVSQAAAIPANLVILSFAAASEMQDDFTHRVARVVMDRAPCEVILNKLARSG